MSTTVLEALQNAQCNFENIRKMGFKNNPLYEFAMDQLKNGIEALEKGKNPDDILQEYMFGEIKI